MKFLRAACKAMKRLLHIGFIVGLACSVTTKGSAASNAGAPRPNIILILADDAGYSDFGCYGGEIPTPNIDALAANGVRLTQFYNNASCGPTRASLLTGLYCQQVGHSGRTWNDATNFSKSVTLADVLKSAGYHTMMVGKWQERQLPARHGFDRFFGPMCAGTISYFDEVEMNKFYLDEERWQFPDDGFYLTDALTDHALQFMDEARKKEPDPSRRAPFFLYVAHLAPHFPLHALEADIAPHREKYRQRGWDEWRAQRFARQRELGVISREWTLAPAPPEVGRWKDAPHREWQAERMAVYAAQITALDRSVGRIMTAVRDAGIADNTLFVFLSDNGAARDGDPAPAKAPARTFAARVAKPGWRLDKGAMRIGSGPDIMPGPADTFDAYGLPWTTTSNTPFREAKGSCYEGGIRTPFIAHWPAGISRRGQTSAHVGHMIDFMATFVELSGARFPEGTGRRELLPLEGKSLWPAWRGEASVGHDQLCWRSGLNRAIRAGRWKLVETIGAAPTWELFDLDADATETTNLAARFPERVKDLSRRWDEWAARCGAKRSPAGVLDFPISRAAATTPP